MIRPATPAPAPATRVVRERPRPADVGLAILYAATFLGTTAVQLRTGVFHLPWISDAGLATPGLQPTFVLASRAAIAFATVCAVALAWRRAWPEAAFLVIAAVGAAQLAMGEPIGFWNVAMLIALFSVAAYGRRGFARLALLIAVGGYVGLFALQVNLPARLGDLPNPVEILGTAKGATIAIVFALLVLVWALGDQVRSGRERLERDLERAEELAREQEANVRLGTLAERHRIARELHDVVAHGLSVMIVQADGAQYAADEHPDAPKQALATIAATGRESLAEMRRLLGVLRDEPNAETLAPQPELASLPALIDRFRASGLDVAFTAEGPARPVPPAVGLTAYRVVQESLTNVLHHVGPTRVDVRVAGDATTLELDVANPPGAVPPPRPDTAPRGLGLLGMRERVGLLHGRMTAGPTPAGGFRVHVELPVGTGAVDPIPRDAGGDWQPRPAGGPDATRGPA